MAPKVLVKEVLSFEQTSGICSEETSDTLRKLLEGVVVAGLREKMQRLKVMR